MDSITIKGEEFVVLSKFEYDNLVYDTNLLMCLEAAGVDNWEGYGEAKAMMMEGED